MEIRVKTLTKVKKESVEQLKDGRYLVSVNADRKGGEANERVCLLISKHFGIDDKEVQIIKGHTSSTKTLRVKDKI